MSVLSKTNNQPVTVPFIEFPDTGNTSLLLLCIPRQTSTFSVVACIKIDLSVLGQRLKVSKFLYYGILFDNFLVISNDIYSSGTTNPQLVITFDNKVGSGMPQNQTFDLAAAKIPPQAFSWQGNS
jgi:hypothetical protein